MTSLAFLICTLELYKNRDYILPFKFPWSTDFSGLPFWFRQMSSKFLKDLCVKHKYVNICDFNFKTRALS